MHVVPTRSSTRSRRLPCGPEEPARYQADRDALLARARQIDAAQRALAEQMAGIRTELAQMRVLMWLRVESKDIVHGFRHTRVKGPPPIPPVAKNAFPRTASTCASPLWPSSPAPVAR